MYVFHSSIYLFINKVINLTDSIQLFNLNINSFSLKGFELALTAWVFNKEFIVVTLFNNPSINHLRHQVGGHFTRLILLLELEDLLLEIVNHSQLISCFFLLEKSS